VKLKSDGKRQQDAIDRLEEQREAKRVKREAVVDG